MVDIGLFGRFFNIQPLRFLLAFAPVARLAAVSGFDLASIRMGAVILTPAPLNIGLLAPPRQRIPLCDFALVIEIEKQIEKLIILALDSQSLGIELLLQKLLMDVVDIEIQTDRHAVLLVLDFLPVYPLQPLRTLYLLHV